MDSGRSPSAPQPGWSNNEKSQMNQGAPPPYQDPQYSGYPQPGPGYPNPQPGSGFQPQYGGVPYGQQTYPMGPGQQYQPQPGVIGVQPTVYVTQTPLGNPVNDYMGYSIFTMLCCCLPLGVAALIYSISAREANLTGNRMTAERASRTARTLNHVAVGLGIGMLILTIVYIAVIMSVA